MPKLYITEISVFGEDLRGRETPWPKMPAELDYSIDIGSDSNLSEPFGPRTTHVMVVSEVDCSLAWGRDPLATKDSGFLAAGVDRTVGINRGDRLAVIANEPE